MNCPPPNGLLKLLYIDPNPHRSCLGLSRKVLCLPARKRRKYPSPRLCVALYLNLHCLELVQDLKNCPGPDLYHLSFATSTFTLSTSIMAVGGALGKHSSVLKLNFVIIIILIFNLAKPNPSSSEILRNKQSVIHLLSVVGRKLHCQHAWKSWLDPKGFNYCRWYNSR